jgi:hypothetical protein
MALYQRIYHSWDDMDIINISMTQDCLGKAIEVVTQGERGATNTYIGINELRMIVAQLEAWEPTAPNT